MEHVALYPVMLEVWAAAAKIGTRARFSQAMQALYTAFRAQIGALITEAQRQRRNQARGRCRGAGRHADRRGRRAAAAILARSQLRSTCLGQEFHERAVRRHRRQSEEVIPCACVFPLLVLATLAALPARAFAADADALLRAAFDNWRAKSSQTEITMIVHRPDWERSMTMKAWTQGDDDALVRFVAPAKDAGNATLEKGRRDLGVQSQAQSGDQAAGQHAGAKLDGLGFLLQRSVQVRRPADRIHPQDRRREDSRAATPSTRSTPSPSPARRWCGASCRSSCATTA